MFHDPQFWVAVAFVLFVLAVFKPVSKVVVAALDKRSNDIQKALDEALRLKEEAQSLLASYQRKQKEAIEEAEKIVRTAEEEAKHIMSEAEHNLEETLNKKIQAAMLKIASYENSVINEVRASAVDITMETVHNLLKANLNPEIANVLVTRSVQEMHDKLH